MRLRRLQQRARPFRFWGFSTLALVCLLTPAGQRSPWQHWGGVLFCLAWPWLADRALGWCRRRDEASLTVQLVAYAAECALVAALLGWASVAPLAGLAAALCLLSGATALAGWRLLVPGAAGVAAGAALGAFLAPAWSAASAPAADALAMTVILGFGIALGQLAFRQAQRLDAQRLALAARSAELERLNRRMQRYLPPSLRRRLERAPDAPCRWERRWLSVAFVDLVGFTELAERLDAEPLAGILDEYLAALVQAAEARGGEISKLLGDGVMVVFGGHERGRRHQAAEALAFCGEVPGLLRALAERWRARGDLVELAARAGVASGYCTLGDRGGAGRLDFTLIGGPVNLASRLQGHAPVNGVMMDAATAALAERRYELGPPRTVDLKGLGNMPAYVLP